MLWVVGSTDAEGLHKKSARQRVFRWDHHAVKCATTTFRDHFNVAKNSVFPPLSQRRTPAQGSSLMAIIACILEPERFYFVVSTQVPVRHDRIEFVLEKALEITMIILQNFCLLLCSLKCPSGHRGHSSPAQLLYSAHISAIYRAQ